MFDTGIVVILEIEKGCGIIESCAIDYFFQSRDVSGGLFSSLLEGQDVEFVAEIFESGPKATQVRIVP